MDTHEKIFNGLKYVSIVVLSLIIIYAIFEGRIYGGGGVWDLDKDPFFYCVHLVVVFFLLSGAVLVKYPGKKDK